MILIDTARKINKYIKKHKKTQAGKYLSLSRRIERVHPIKDKRYIAMTFDDGPSAVTPEPNTMDAEMGLTEVLLDILQKYNAKGTFDVIGTTEYNYPDKLGKLGTASWGGTRHDHYPDFHNDKLAGVKNQTELARLIISRGHEVSNHGYRHVLFGPMRLVYGRRDHFKNLDEVVEDLNKLHNMVKTELNYDMKLSRPPHYIDNIPGGYNSYDAYTIMGYKYLAASLDGGGWKPSSGDYQQDLRAMVIPLENALKGGTNSLNGQIIFQKDGYNMSHQTPVADALDKQLELLINNGYEIITVSELLSQSPFEDLNPEDDIFESVRLMDSMGLCIGYKNNTFQPDRELTMGELVMMITPPEYIRAHYIKSFLSKSLFDLGVEISTHSVIIPKTHPYKAGAEYAASKGYIGDRLNPEEIVTAATFGNFLSKAAIGKNVNWSSKEQGNIKRRDVCDAIAQLMST
ncbi:MAG: polysaccharide deacetylase family protein [Lutisporaceae bacterium]